MKKFSFLYATASFSVISYFAFVVFSPYLQTLFPGARQLTFSAAVLSIPFVIAHPAFRSRLSCFDSRLLLFLIIYPILMLVIGTFLNTGGLAEISTFVSIYFALAAILVVDTTIKLIAAATIINLLVLIFEFYNGTYLYDDLFNMAGELVRSINIASYGEIGFRAKGLFAGPLDATSFIIYAALIFRNKPGILGICMVSALLTNGRLAILVCAVLLLGRSKLSLKNSAIIAAVVSCGLFFLLRLQDDLALQNLLSVFDLSSDSNTGRIAYATAGITYLGSIGLFDLLFGSSTYFLDVNDGHSAESGVISMLISHGVFGLIFLAVVFSGVGNRLRRDHMILLLVALCLLIYRFDVGFMRSFFLYFTLLYASRETFLDNHR